MKKIYTIGFTGKKGRAREFFGLLKENGVTMLVDVRLNTSQLDGFAQKTDLEYICELNDIIYKDDGEHFAPEKLTLKKWQANGAKDLKYHDKETGKTYDAISWLEYEMEFDDTMAERNISDYIESNYDDSFRKQVICLQCSEPTPENCHRRLIANYFKSVFEEKYGEEVLIVHI